MNADILYILIIFLKKQFVFFFLDYVRKMITQIIQKIINFLLISSRLHSFNINVYHYRHIFQK